MSALYIVIGLVPPTIIGWLLLELLQYRTRVLLRAEQWIMGMVMGITFAMLCIFVAHATAHIPLTFLGMFSVQAALILLLGGVRMLLPAPQGSPVLPSPRAFPRWAYVLASIVGLWIVVKILVLTTVFLFLTPTYVDDSLDNWNLRGKVYFYDQALTLALPAEDPVESPKGISSYPPAVPLLKTWLATVAREWSDPLVNGVHIVWYIAALALLFCVLLRIVGRGWSYIGIAILGGMPLYIMHGTNPYADAFVSVHVFSAVSMVFLALRTQDDAQRAAYMRIGAVAAGLLTFTKNEGTMIYLPTLLVILAAGSAYLWKAHMFSTRSLLQAALWYAGSISALALPWLIFKWANGLTFGNAKPIGSLNLGWQQGVLQAIGVNTYMEGNWLLLFPLLAALLLWRWRAAVRRYLPLTVFFLVVYGGQLLLFLFTELAWEARMQTGLARGVIQLLPVIVLLTTLLLADASAPITGGLKELALRTKKLVD